MRTFRVKAPFRVSSIRKGEYLRPALFTLIEDVVAVDGNGGSGYRVNLRARYEASRDFRHLLVFMTWFWMVPSLLVAVATSMVIFWPNLLSRDLAYVVRMSVQLFLTLTDDGEDWMVSSCCVYHYLGSFYDLDCSICPAEGEAELD